MIPSAEDVLKRQGRLESERSSFDRLFQEVGELMLPRQADFNSSFGFGNRMNQGQSRTSRIIDETAQFGLDHAIATFEGYVIPQGGLWQALIPKDESLRKNRRVMLFMEKLTKRLFDLRTSPQSGFASSMHESTASLLAFGNQSTWPDILYDARGVATGLSYRSEHIGEIFIEEDYRGAIVRSHRRFMLRADEAVKLWGDRAPEAARKAIADNRPEQEAKYIQVIEPNTEYEEGRLDAKGKPWRTYFVECSGKQLFGEGGYRALPRIFSRYDKSPTETYGRGPAFSALPSVRACQEIMADLVTAIEFAAKPALGAHEDLLDQLINYAPGEISYGAIDDRGQPLLKPLFENADIRSALELLQDTRRRIERAFFMDLYVARQEIKSHVSATEMLQREQEKGQLLAPLKRQETDWLDPMTVRELDLMAELGLLDDMPPELEEAGAEYAITYDNPLGRAREAGAASGFFQLQAQLAPMMQLNPDYAAAFAEMFPADKVIPPLAGIMAVPESWRSSDDEAKAAKAKREGAADAATLLEAGDQAAGIAQKLVSSEAIAGAPNAS